MQRRDVFRSAEMPFPLDDVEANTKQDLEGPRRALFEAWAEDALRTMEEGNNTTEVAQNTPGPKKTVLELVQKRLELNLPVIQHLPAVSSISTCSISQRR